MSETPFSAFRFEASRRDVNAPGGLLKTHYIAVKRTLEEATAAVSDVVPDPRSLRLLDSGDDVLSEARRRGLRDGDVSEL